MKNKKPLTFGIALMMLPLLLLSATVTETQAADKPIIVCTTSAVGNVVEEFLGDTADVLVLVQPGLCPADFDMKPGYVDAVSKADILFKQNVCFAHGVDVSGLHVKVGGAQTGLNQH